MTDKNLALTDDELIALESQAQGDVLRLIAEVRGLRQERKLLCAGLDTALIYLDTIIAAYQQPGIGGLVNACRIAKEWRGVKDVVAKNG